MDTKNDDLDFMHPPASNIYRYCLVSIRSISGGNNYHAFSDFAPWGFQGHISQDHLGCTSRKMKNCLTENELPINGCKIAIPWNYPPPRVPVANEGLGWDPLLKIYRNPRWERWVFARFVFFPFFPFSAFQMSKNSGKTKKTKKNNPVRRILGKSM